jgi:hypothetical protein
VLRAHCQRGIGHDHVVPPEIAQEVPHQPGQVVGARAQRRHGNDGRGQSKEEVLAKLSGRNLAPKLSVGSGHDAHVELSLLRSTDASHAACLEHAKEARLEIDRQLADFVQEERAAVGALEGAEVGSDGARERAALVSEQLALGQVGGDATAVEHDEGASRTSALLVKRMRQHVLAGAGLAEQREGDVGGGKTPQQLERFAQERRPGYEFSESPSRFDVAAAWHRRLKLASCPHAVASLVLRGELGSATSGFLPSLRFGRWGPALFKDMSKQST